MKLKHAIIHLGGLLMDKAIETGHNLVVYLESEMADEKNHSFDALWQSIYDVCKLAYYKIIDIDQEDLEAGIRWLKENQHYTKDYQEFIFEF